MHKGVYYANCGHIPAIIRVYETPMSDGAFYGPRQIRYGEKSSWVLGTFQVKTSKDLFIVMNEYGQVIIELRPLPFRVHRNSFFSLLSRGFPVQEHLKYAPIVERFHVRAFELIAARIQIAEKLGKICIERANETLF